MTQTPSAASKIVKHSTVYAVGNITRQLIGFLMLPIYTQYLTPADYGVVALLTYAMSLMEPFFGARLGEAMPKFFFQEDSPSRRNAVISTALIITSVVSGLTASILFLARDETSGVLFGSSDFGLTVGLFGILILTQAVEYYGMTFVRILQRPLLFISISLSKLVVQLSLNIGLVVVLKMGVMGVVISSVASSSLYALALAIYMLSKTGVKFDNTLARSMLTFSWPLWFVGLASLYIYSGNRYFLRIFGSLEDIGLLELAAKFGSILLFLIWSPFNQFWETERFNLYRQQTNGKVFSQTFQFLTFLLLAASLCIGILAEPAIRVMSDDSFHAAYTAVPALVIAYLFSCLGSFANFSLLVTDQTRLVSRIGYATVVVATALNFALIPKFGFNGAAFALAGALAFQFFATYIAGRRHFDMGLELRLPLLTTIGCGIVFAISTLILVFENVWVDLAASCALLIGSLLALTWIAWQQPSIREQTQAAIAGLRNKFSR